ncbi:MAG: flagellar biosynthesis protein FlhA [Actinobacteria bacterium]|nr:flagellar biosynthesis protein FlhA [Actinomycetota bacterium]
MPALLVGAVLMMVIPLPAVLLDVLLAVNITVAIVILLTVMNLKDTLQLSVFPSLLLMTTLVRLALNVSSTRLVLLDGYAGKVIETFGNFVIGGSVVVGLVVFLILIVIQFAVITNGAGRVAEVAARFTLDAMPGKQMAIDADLAAGLIDEDQARARRERVAKEADFHGAMDGASKFVKGDAMAGIIIVVINLIGGLTIGIVSLGMDVSEAAATYALLTVGDGLVSQIPALMISIATGLLVTRVGDDDDLGPQVGHQLFANPEALRVAAIIAGAFMLVPGLPKVPFLVMAVALYAVATKRRTEAAGAEAAGDEASSVVVAGADDPESLIGQMKVEALELHLAYDILDLTDPARGGDLLDRVRALRQQVATDLGIVMPYVRTRDDVSLPTATYRILLHGVEIARGAAPRDRVLALPSGDGRELASLGAEETVEPVFNLPAYWVPVEARSAAGAAGATVVDRSSVVVTHLAEVVRANAAELLTRQQVQLLVEGLRYDEPLLAGEIGSEMLPLPLFQAVLRRLLADRVPIRDLGRIAEAVAARAAETRAVEHLAAAARVALGPAIVARVAPEGKLAVLTIDPALEASLHECLQEVDGTVHLVIDPARLQRIGLQIQHHLERPLADPAPVAVVTGQPLRAPLARSFASLGLELPMLAYPELPAHVRIDAIGVIDDVHAHA